MKLPHMMGPFELLESLGAGGMGEVFKARDKRLNRFVAIKFLPEAAAAQARERFQREAMAIAALNHANICTLHEVGEENGRPYLVLELLEGENLRARLRRGAVAPEQVLEWGIQIADALDTAYRKGILHRDLKPENLWVTTGGQLKVLDFGLARLEAEDSAEAPTVDIALTSPGQTMGTYPYMSPEQARGEALDARSDLFSLGSVLYEMASGRQPFARASAAETMAAVLKEQPPALEQPELERVIGRLLEKDADLRYQSAADLRGELKRAKRASSSGTSAVASGPAARVPASRGARHWLWPAVIVLIAAVGAVSYWKLRPAPSAPAAPPKLSFEPLTNTGHVVDAVISPDGKFLAHVDVSTQGNSLRLLSISSNSDIEIVPPGTGCCQSPSFSPDGGQVYFLQGLGLRDVLKAVPVLGGAARIIATEACSGAGFSADGRQIAFVALDRSLRPPRTALMLAQPDGSGIHRLSTAPAGTGYLSQCWGPPPPSAMHAPAWSPDGRWIAVTSSAVGKFTSQIDLVDTQNGKVRVTGAGLGSPSPDINWLPGGRGLIFTGKIPLLSSSQLWELGFPSGKLVQLTDGPQGVTHISLSDQGQLVLLQATATASLWVQAQVGSAFRQLPGGGADNDGRNGLAWTPQGGLISTRSFRGKTQLWTERADGSSAQAVPLAATLLRALEPQVAADGQIVFLGESAGEFPTTIWRVKADGSGLTMLVRGGYIRGGARLALDGREVIYTARGAPNGWDVWSVPLAGGTARELLQGYIVLGSVSPDGTEVLAAAVASKNAPSVILRLGGASPQVLPMAAGFETLQPRPPYGWTPDGRAITFIRHQGSVDNIWTFPVSRGKPYAVTHFTDQLITAYAFSKDGRLVVSRGSDNSDAVLATGLEGKP